MAKYFLTYLQRIGDDYLRWASCDDKSKTVANYGHGTFAEAATAAGRLRTVMVVAGTELLIEEATVPAPNLAKAHKAVRFALEETLAQDVESSHFAFGTRLPDGEIPVAVIARTSMDWMRAQCENSGLKPQEIVPETTALPLDRDRWTVMTNTDHAAVRLSATRGFSCDVEMLPLLLENIPDVELEEKMWHTLHFSCGDDRYDLETGSSPIEMGSEIELFAVGLKQKANTRINLLQGDYGKRKSNADRSLKQWATPAVLATVLLGLWGGSSWMTYNALGQQQQRLKGEIEATLKSAFPDVQRVVNPVAQMRNRVKKASGSGIDNGGFVAMMSAMGEALEQVDKPAVRSVVFSRGKLTVDLDAGSLQDLDKIKSNLESERQLAAKVQSANKERDRIRARLRVETQL